MLIEMVVGFDGAECLGADLNGGEWAGVSIRDFNLQLVKAWQNRKQMDEGVWTFLTK